MNLKNGQPADAIGVRCHELAKGVSYSVSDDGTAALFVFEDSLGERIAFTAPLDRLKAIRSMFNDAIGAAEKAEAGTGNVLVKRPKKYSIGHSDQYRGHVAVQFEEGSQDEAVYLLDDRSALGFARAIERDVMDRASAADRDRMSRELRRPRSLILPGRQ